MEIISKTKNHSTRRSHYPAKIILLVLGLILLLLVGIHWQLIVSTIELFYKMERLLPWSEVTSDSAVEMYPLDEAKQIASLLLEQPEQNRRRMIAAYQMYVEIRSWKAGASADLPAASKLFILLRLLFDVPEDYPQDRAKFFGGWMSLLIREDGSLTMGAPTREYESRTVNLLWPLGYQDGRLVLKGTFFAYRGFPYNGLGEYDYFTSHFPLRSVDDLD